MAGWAENLPPAIPRGCHNAPRREIIMAGRGNAKEQAEKRNSRTKALHCRKDDGRAETRRVGYSPFVTRRRRV
ncbi:MAG: hypothetical protein FWD31_07890 [Planctomycetaceae bacterium]|nr:hypothetical protein [Planctomycetaceae bacterium]